MAQTGEYILGAGMYTWQLITGTGFFFENIAAQAFFINQLGGILATIAIIAGLSLLLDTPGKKSALALPIMLGIIYYLMPMTIFQQAKDMKLDPALMFVSVGALLSLWYGIKSIIQDKTRIGYSLVLIAGLLTGIAFGIKFTTLMFIIAGFGCLAYKFLGLAGYLGYFSIFLGIFTAGRLWEKIFVWMPADSFFIALACGIIGILLLIW